MGEFTDAPPWKPESEHRPPMKHPAPRNHSMQAQHHARKAGLAILGLAILTTQTGCVTMPPSSSSGSQSQPGFGMSTQGDPDSFDALKDAERAREHAEARAREAEVALNQARALASSAREHAEARSREAETALIRARELESQLEGGNETEDRPQADRSRTADPAPMQNMQQTSRGMVLTLGDVLFDLGRAELKPGAARTIKRLSEFLEDHPNHVALVEGHTDNTGNADLNRRLSLQRAESVRNALVLRGVPPERIAVKGFGSDYPIATNDTAAGRQKNRRVEVILSDESGRIPETS
ncbi:MAG: OmpA family protein [Ectothiorhodospira sp.]